MVANSSELIVVQMVQMQMFQKRPPVEVALHDALAVRLLHQLLVSCVVRHCFQNVSRYCQHVPIAVHHHGDGSGSVIPATHFPEDFVDQHHDLLGAMIDVDGAVVGDQFHVCGGDRRDVGP